MAVAIESQRKLSVLSTRFSNFGEHTLANVGFEGARHLIPERMPSARRERTVAVRVIDLNPEVVQNIKQLSSSLKRLNLSGLHLKTLNEDLICSSTNLAVLDLSYNELTEESFPDTLKSLENLTELCIDTNQLTLIPKSFRKLKHLSRLKMGNNLLSNIDGVQKHRKLQVLIVDYNQIESISREFYNNLKRLEMFHCANNRIRLISNDITLLRHLKDLNISNNKITSLPTEVFLLPQLEQLNANGNQISRLPTINVKGRVERQLDSIDLSDNLITKFPEHLQFMTQKLDLSRNRIKTISGSILQKLEWDTKQELDVSENPLQHPPLDICECGLRAIVQYFQESKGQTKAYQGLKILVIGSAGAGKTSLVQTIIDQQPHLTEVEEETQGIDIYDFALSIPETETESTDDSANSEIGNTRQGSTMEKDEAEDDEDDEDENEKSKAGPTEKSLQLSIWDFSGQPHYLFTNLFFLQLPALFVLVFNMAEYKDHQFDDTIGCWLDWVIFKTNKLILLPVGTNADKLPAHKIKHVCDGVSKKILQHIESHKNSVKAEIKKIEKKPQISPALSEQLKLFVNLLRLECTIHHEVLPVSSHDMQGVDDLMETLKNMALKVDVFPDVMRIIPSLWTNVEQYVEDKGYAMKVPIMQWDCYVEEVTGKFGMKHLITSITQYLHDTGKVLWFSDHPTLKDHVILRPSWLTDVLKPIFRHSYSGMDYNLEEKIKHCSMNHSKFDKLQKDLAENGIIDKDFLKVVWTQLLPTDVYRTVLEVLEILLQHFGIGYAMNKPGRDYATSTYSRSSEKESVGEKESRKSDRDRPDSSSTTRSSRSNRDRPESSKKRDKRGSSSRNDKIPTRVELSGSILSKCNDLSDSGIRPRGKFAVPTANCIICPWLRHPEQPATFREDYDKYSDNTNITAVYRFPKYAAPGFFEMMVVRALSGTEPQFLFIYQWQGGLYSQHVSKPVRLYLQRINHDDGSMCIRVEVRHKNVEDENEVEHLWATLLPYLQDIETLIARFPGAYFERHMECPGCRTISFLGEWITPKELQSMQTKQCESCKEDIETKLLVQPRERRRVDYFLRQKLRK